MLERLPALLYIAACPAGNARTRDSSGSNKSHKYLTRTELAGHQQVQWDRAGAKVSSLRMSDLWEAGRSQVTSRRVAEYLLERKEGICLVRNVLFFRQVFFFFS